MKEKFLVFLLCAVCAFCVNLTVFFSNKNCDPKCTFENQNVTSKTIGSFPTECSTVCSFLRITDDTDLTEAQLASTFSKMKRLVGGVIVISTKFKSGSFLAGLEAIECDEFDVMWMLNNQMLELGLTNLTSISCAGFQVVSNKKLTKLKMPNLKNITLNEFPEPTDKAMKFSIDSGSPDFCITVEEMENFITAENATVDEIYGKYCPPTTSENLCTFPVICPKVFGDVEIGPSSNLDTMKSIEIIFGSLIINGTNLTDFNFLENLKYVAQLTKDKSAIIVQNNPFLLNVSFSKLKRVRSDNLDTVVFTKNNQNLSQDVSSCFKLKSDLGITSDWSPTFNGDNCDSMNRTAISIERSKSSGYQCSSIFIIVLFAVVDAFLN